MPQSPRSNEPADVGISPTAILPAVSPRLAITVSIALLAIAGCEGTSGNSHTYSGSGNSASSSSSVSCVNDLCRIEVAGDTSGSRLGAFGRDLRVGPIEASAVTVSVGGDKAVITSGETVTVGTLQVRVLSAGGQQASLEVRRG